MTYLSRFTGPEVSYPFIIIAYLGNQKVDTKERLLSMDSGEALFNEKFQISTSIEVSTETGKPVKEKLVHTKLIAFNFLVQI